MLFADRLENYQNEIALFQPGHKPISYAGLASLADKTVAMITGSRQLVFVICRNNISSLAIYIGCLRSRHVPVMLDAQISDEQLQALALKYQPGWLVDSKSGTADFTKFSQESTPLHPNLALMLSTSGSTGSPKFIKLSYTNIESNAASICQYLDLSSSDKAITTLPMNYSYGLSIINSHLYSGASIVVNGFGITTREFWQLFSEQQCSSLEGVPFTYQMFKKLGVAEREFPHLRYFTQAGGKLSADHVVYFARWAESQKNKFYVMYGQTEATARIAYVPPESIASHPESIGIAIPNGNLKIDYSVGGGSISNCRSGELVYCGPNVMMGYASNQKELSTGAEIESLRTGDIAWKDDKDYFYICGRLNRMVKPLGKRIDLAHLEKLLEMQGIEAHCTGDDHQLVVAVLRGAPIDFIEAFVKEKTSLHKKYIKLKVLGDFPKTSNGKINYTSLLEA